MWNLHTLYTMKTMKGLAFAIAISALFCAPAWAGYMEQVVQCAISRKPVAPDAPSLPPGLSAFPVPLPGEEADLSINLLSNTTSPFWLEVEALRVPSSPFAVYQVEVAGQRFSLTPEKESPPYPVWRHARGRNASLALKVRHLSGQSPAGPWEYPWVFSIRME